MPTTVTSLPSSAVSQKLCDASGSRASLTLENNDANRAYIRLGSADASPTDYTFSMVEGAMRNITAPEVYEEMHIVWAADGSGGLEITTVSYGEEAPGLNWGDLKARLAGELHRTTLTDEISAHLLRAIEHYASRRTWQNEGFRTTTTVAETSTAAIPTGLRRADRVAVQLADGNDYELTKITREVMQDRHGMGATSGQPIEYSWDGANFRFWPTPDEAYTVNVNGVYDDTALTTDSDSNSWTTIAADLICARAKYTICRDVTLDAEMMGFALQAEKEARSELFAKTSEQTATNTLRPAW